MADENTNYSVEVVKGRVFIRSNGTTVAEVFGEERIPLANMYAAIGELLDVFNLAARFVESSDRYSPDAAQLKAALSVSLNKAAKKLIPQ